MSPAPKTQYRAGMDALAAAASAFDRAKALGFVWLDGDTGRLFAGEVGQPNAPKNPDQLPLEAAEPLPSWSTTEGKI